MFEGDTLDVVNFIRYLIIPVLIHDAPTCQANFEYFFQQGGISSLLSFIKDEFLRADEMTKITCIHFFEMIPAYYRSVLGQVKSCFEFILKKERDATILSLTWRLLRHYDRILCIPYDKFEEKWDGRLINKIMKNGGLLLTSLLSYLTSLDEKEIYDRITKVALKEEGKEEREFLVGLTRLLNSSDVVLSDFASQVLVLSSFCDNELKHYLILRATIDIGSSFPWRREQALYFLSNAFPFCTKKEASGEKLISTLFNIVHLSRGVAGVGVVRAFLLIFQFLSEKQVKNAMRRIYLGADQGSKFKKSIRAQSIILLVKLMVEDRNYTIPPSILPFIFEILYEVQAEGEGREENENMLSPTFILFKHHLKFFSNHTPPLTFLSF